MAIEEEKKFRVAFVCLGNICRSPMAEAIFTHIVATNNLSDKFEKIDSFGTGSWHVGDTPDHRSAATCRENGVPVNHRAQQIKKSDFRNFDYLLAMDLNNKRNLESMKPKSDKTKILLFGDFKYNDKFDKIVEDPYYGGIHGFKHNFDQIVHFSKGFIHDVVDKDFKLDD